MKYTICVKECASNLYKPIGIQGQKKNTRDYRTRGLRRVAAVACTLLMCTTNKCAYFPFLLIWATNASNSASVASRGMIVTTGFFFFFVALAGALLVSLAFTT